MLLLCQVTVRGTDWPQYRGPASDGCSPDPMASTWATNSADFVVWRNTSLTNGFSSFAIGQGRAFTHLSRTIGGQLQEVCAAVDLATGTNLWATPIDAAPWNPSSTANGGEGKAPYQTGDGPRATPAVKDGRVFALSGQMHLLGLNATNGGVLWSNNLVSLYGASKIAWENGASPRLDDDRLFVNLNTASANLTLLAFNVTNGSMVWRSQNEGMTHSTPVVATIHGVRQVIFATVSGLVSLDCASGTLLWKYVYPFSPISTAMGASPVVYSNLVFCTAAYGRGAAAASVSFTNGTWTVTQLWFKASQSGASYQSTWMTPVCYQGYLYGMFGDKNYTNSPLNCIELATGNLKWSTNNFGMGGIIVVHTNLLGLREDGQLVLLQPNPNAYTEVARYRAFQFTPSTPGKCWNSPAYSDGRIYARSTREGLSLNVAAPSPPRLKWLSAQKLDATQLQLAITTTNGTPLSTDRLAKIAVRATNHLGASPATWPILTNGWVLTTNGLGRLTTVIGPGQARMYYTATEQP